MTDQIKKLEEALKELKETHATQEKKEYESKTHKTFSSGDIVTNGNTVGVVGWTENKLIGCEYDKGYMFLNYITNPRGGGVVKRDDFDLVTDPYYTKTHVMQFALTGLEIEELKYSLGYRNCNPNPTKDKIYSVLDCFQFTKE